MEGSESPDEWVLAEAVRAIREHDPSERWKALWQVLFDAWAERGLPDRAEVYRLMLAALAESAVRGRPLTEHDVKDACWRISHVVYRWVETPLVLHTAAAREPHSTTAPEPNQEPAIGADENDGTRGLAGHGEIDWGTGTEGYRDDESGSTMPLAPPTAILPADEFPGIVHLPEQTWRDQLAPRLRDAAAAWAQALRTQIRASQAAPRRGHPVRRPKPLPRPATRPGPRHYPESGPARDPRARVASEMPRTVPEPRLRRVRPPAASEPPTNILLQSRKLSIQEVADYVKAVHNSLPNEQHRPESDSSC